MGLIGMVALGGLVGWLAAAIMGRDEGIFASIAIGIVGSFIGGILSSTFMSGSSSAMTLSWSGTAWSLVGSVLSVAILNVVQKPHRT